MLRKITDIIIHCADSPNGKNFHAKDIDAWHIVRGFARSRVARMAFNSGLMAIGYHYVIPINGLIETGRSPAEVGAHCQGDNAHSIGVCLIGRDRFTRAQWDSLKMLLEKLLEQFPGAKIHGHYQYPSGIEQGKTCPNFDVDSYVIDGYVPDDEHIWRV